MAFKLVARNAVLVPVRGTITDETGKAERFDFTLTCRRLPATELAQTLKSTERTVYDFLADVIEGWTGVLDADGHPVPCTPDNIAALLDQPGVGVLAYKAYLEEHGAKEKN
jgi:hypothetical protein